MERTWIVRRTTEVVVQAGSAIDAITAAGQLHQDQAIAVEINATARWPEVLLELESRLGPNPLP